MTGSLSHVPPLCCCARILLCVAIARHEKRFHLFVFENLHRWSCGSGAVREREERPAGLFSLSPSGRRYFVDECESAPTAVIIASTRAPPALAADAKAVG